MSFIWPTMLFLLVLVPLSVGVYILIQQRRTRLAAWSESLGFGQGNRRQKPGVHRHIPYAFFLAGLTILVIALARPQAVVSLPRMEGTVILAFDVSGSMAAEDLQPTRMEAAKAAAREFVQRMPPSVQVGVVAFSDSGFSVQAPTNDREALLTTINRLSPERGTALSQGIFASLNTIAASLGLDPPEQTFSQDEDQEHAFAPIPGGVDGAAVIVLISDGENNMLPDPLAAAQTSADSGVRIDTVGIGSPAGVTLNIDGFAVHTQLDEAMLRSIAQITGGDYYNAVDEDDLLQISEKLAPQLVIKPEKIEVTSILVGASMLVLLLGGLFSLFWFSRLP